jgi:hypothetical protein
MNKLIILTLYFGKCYMNELYEYELEIYLKPAMNHNLKI